MTLSHLHAVAPAAEPIDLARAPRAARELLLALGADLEDESLRDTPRRMAETYVELLTPRAVQRHDLPQRRGLRRARRRARHPVPLAVRAPPAAVPRRRPRRLPAGRADHRPVEARPRGRPLRPRPAGAGAPHDPGRRWLDRHARSRSGVGVVIEAEHLCMSLRGVQKPGARTITSALHGLVRDDPRTRQEFLTLTGEPRMSSSDTFVIVGAGMAGAQGGRDPPRGGLRRAHRAVGAERTARTSGRRFARTTCGARAEPRLAAARRGLVRGAPGRAARRRRWPSDRRGRGAVVLAGGERWATTVC